MSKIYEIDNPSFITDKFVFKIIKNYSRDREDETLWVKVDSYNKICEMGINLQDRLHCPGIPITELIEKARDASDEHKRTFRTIGVEYWDTLRLITACPSAH